MNRSTAFNPEREPLRDHPSLQLAPSTVRGPFHFLNPTQAHYRHQQPATSKPTSSHDDSDDAEQQGTPEVTRPSSGVAYKWTSRNNRKGRHTLVVKPSPAGANQGSSGPPPKDGVREVMSGVLKMFTYYPFWDVSWLVAYVFTIGSIVWVINAFFSLLPLTNPSTQFSGETLYGGGITAFIGATIFEFGSVLLMLEAFNENRSGCFGWALEQAYENHLEPQSGNRLAPSDDCTHHHAKKRNTVRKPTNTDSLAPNEKSSPASADRSPPPGAASWVWWPSYHELITHHLHDLGFLACSAQMFGASVFWISGFTALPGIYNVISNTTRVLNGVYWVPQVVGGSGFIVSGTLFMIETQKRWYRPALRELGWHIGLWNLIGGLGFTLCPIFGFGTVEWRVLQASVSTFWGSWAFLIGSLIQLYESVAKHPVEKMKES
ncbi:hypothetical protein LTR35_014662 [Friedmanniomyces endolithicus]|uniref:Integral membrane protein n=1 Tax=Friedmanniomyces endolithicus TaxID=329885 RepID=A0AAN6J459_9PEZI|nr:hypothetical protein LTR35_014662 [Friedmanniomyces endolithicus]KAK0272820.1 hypothetical protein LTS00_016083 [Friedmanniomyces endolithicus]KAK0315928.1 hypothetical protein LTR82_012464 [Friedmanniomyces endolithicus]KAK0976558.1 hypothetical protein LTR54_016487 [Friedmanniomyces endolithicus]